MSVTHKVDSAADGRSPEKCVRVFHMPPGEESLQQLKCKASAAGFASRDESWSQGGCCFEVFVDFPLIFIDDSVIV
jgi:hypothetical protein